MTRSSTNREIPEPTHTDSPFFYGMEREHRKQPMTEVIQAAIVGYQARYGTDHAPKYLVCHADLAAQLGPEHAGMEVRPWTCVSANVVYVGRNPPV